VIRTASLAAGIAAGALLVRTRRQRERAERFAAAALEALLRAIDANDPETGKHVRRVATYALILADAIGVDDDERRTIELTALFHDIGKIHEALFDIVHENRTLDASERRAIATHPVRGAAVLAPIASFHPRLALAVLSHHERWDGAGYPRGLRGQRIPIAARVVTLADTFDAVTHGRRYRRVRTARQAANIILAGRGTQFDPSLVDVFMFPPVLEQLTRAHRLMASKKLGRKRHSARPIAHAPSIEFRWRTRSNLPHGLREQVARSS
jgi:putative two-component system response regulator